MILVKRVEEKQVAYIYHKGSYEEIDTLMSSVINWANIKGLKIAGPPFGVYYNFSQKVSPEELEYKVGIPFLGEVKEENEIKIGKIHERHVISTIYKGPYNNTTFFYDAIVDYAIDNGFEIAEFPMEIYLNNSYDVPDAELLTEIQFPIIKRSSKAKINAKDTKKRGTPI